jgi:hypothetical protein
MYHDILENGGMRVAGIRRYISVDSIRHMGRASKHQSTWDPTSKPKSILGSDGLFMKSAGLRGP